MISIKKIMSVIAIAFAVMTIAGSGVYSFAAESIDPCRGTNSAKAIGCNSGVFDIFGAQALKDGGFGFNTIQGVLVSFASGLITIISVVSVIYLILGAYKMISDNGDGKKFSAGKDNVKYAIVGLVVALLSFFLVSTISTLVLKQSS
jgi:Type IV secretion system pilin